MSKWSERYGDEYSINGSFTWFIWTLCAYLALLLTSCPALFRYNCLSGSCKPTRLVTFVVKGSEPKYCMEKQLPTGVCGSSFAISVNIFSICACTLFLMELDGETLLNSFSVIACRRSLDESLLLRPLIDPLTDEARLRSRNERWLIMDLKGWKGKKKMNNIACYFKIRPDLSETTYRLWFIFF